MQTCEVPFCYELKSVGSLCLNHHNDIQSITNWGYFPGMVSAEALLVVLLEKLRKVGVPI